MICDLTKILRTPKRTFWHDWNWNIKQFYCWRKIARVADYGKKVALALISLCSSKGKRYSSYKTCHYSGKTSNGSNSKCNKYIKEENLNGWLYTSKVKKDFLKHREKEKSNSGIRKHYKIDKELKQYFLQNIYIFLQNTW